MTNEATVTRLALGVLQAWAKCCEGQDRDCDCLLNRLVGALTLYGHARYGAGYAAGFEDERRRVQTMFGRLLDAAQSR